MVRGAAIVRLANTNIETMRSTVNGVVRRATGRGALIHLPENIVTAPVRTNVFGVALPLLVVAVAIARPGGTKSNVYLQRFPAFNLSVGFLS